MSNINYVTPRVKMALRFSFIIDYMSDELNIASLRTKPESSTRHLQMKVIHINYTTRDYIHKSDVTGSKHAEYNNKKCPPLKMKVWNKMSSKVGSGSYT